MVWPFCDQYLRRILSFTIIFILFKIISLYDVKVYGNYHIWIIWLWIKKYFMNNQFHAFLEEYMYSNIKYHSFCNLVYKKGSGKQFQIYNKHWHFWISKQVQSQSNICQGGKKDNHEQLQFSKIGYFTIQTYIAHLHVL